MTRFLLNAHFTTERLDRRELTLKDIQTYADSLQVSARVWQQLHFPEDHENTLNREVARGLIRLERLGFGVLRPLLLAALSQGEAPEQLVQLLHEAERFLLLVRSWSGTRSHIGEADSYRMAHDVHEKRARISDAAAMVSDRVSRHFSSAAFQTEIDDLFAEDDSKGFFGLPGLKFLLFEYEECLRIEGKSAAAKISWEGFRRGTKLGRTCVSADAWSPTHGPH